MQLAPKKWTYHHTLRFFHVSLLAVWLFIMAVILFGLLFVLRQASADQIVQTLAVGTSATVPEISTGPVVTPPSEIGGGTYFPPPTATSSPPLGSLQYPVVTVNPDPNLGSAVSQSGPDGKPRQVFAFSGSTIRFFGDTNIKNALIFIQITGAQTFRSTAVADGNLHWAWVSPVGLSAGWYSISVLAEDPVYSVIQASASEQFYVEKSSLQPPIGPGRPPETSGLFDVFLSIPDQYQTILPGEQLEAEFTLVPEGGLAKPAEVPVEYIIYDPAGKVVIDATEILTVLGQQSFVKTFYTNPETPAGQYSLTIKLPSQATLSVASALFTVEGQSVIPVVKNIVIDYTVLFQALLVLFLLFSLIAYFEYNKVVILSRKIRKVSEEDLKDDIKHL